LTDIADSRSDDLDFCSVFNVFYVFYEDEKHVFMFFYFQFNVFIIYGLNH